MVRDQLSDDVAMNYIFPPVNDALGMSSSDNSPRPPCQITLSSVATEFYVKVSVSNGLSVMDDN